MVDLLELSPGISIKHVGHPFSLDRLNGVVYSGAACTE